MPKKYNPLLPTGLDYYETNAPGGGITNIRISAGTAAQNLSAFTLSNSNNVSFGISASTITASASYPAQTSYVFSNSNGVTFGTNGSTVTASVATNYQSQGAYLTTAALSQDSSKYAGINGAITGGSLTVNTSGVSINLPAYLTTAQPVGDYLTTAMASNRGSDFVQATAAFAGTNASGTIASNGISISVNPGGGAGDGYNIVGVNGNSVGSAATVQFSNGNNVTFGLAGSTVTASASYPAQTAFVFSNSNGVSFGTNGSTVTATVATNYQSQGAYLTTARASNDAIGLNTALTANGVAWTVNSSGLSLNVPAFLTTAMQSNAATLSNIRVSGGTTSNLLSAITFSNSNGVSFGLNAGTMTASHNGLTTAAQSDHSHGNPTLALTNLSGTTASNSNGLTLSLSAAAPGGGAAVTVSASNGSFTVGQLNFSNANNVTFGTSAGSIVTASVAAPGAAAENNNINLLGANTAGNTTASGSTIGYSGINLTLSGTNGSVVNISAPATSSISAVNGFYISANASTISMGQAVQQFFEPMPFNQAQSTTFAPGVGTWYLHPMYLPYPLASGRANILVSMGSTSNMFVLSNGSSFATGTTGSRAISFVLSRGIALYTRGAGANSTRFDSIWSNTWGASISQTVGVSVTNASQLTVNNQISINIVSQVGTDGAYTTSGYGATHNASTAASSVSTSAFTSGLSSIRNMLSGAMLVPLGFNTSLTPGNYLLAHMYSTASTTAGTSVNGASVWPQVNMVGLYKMASYSHRQFGSTASSTGSQYYLPQGMFSAVSSAAPATINPRDVRSYASNAQPYVNFMQSNFN